MHGVNTEHNDLKIKDKEKYHDFIKRGKQFIQGTKIEKGHTGEESEDEEKMMLHKFQMQTKMVNEESERKEEEAEQMAQRIKLIRLENDRERKGENATITTFKTGRR